MDEAPNRIRAIRLRAGLSQRELAEKVGVSTVTISSLEVGRMQLTLDYMKRIARQFGCPPVDLLNEDEQNLFMAGDVMELVRAYRAAGSFQRELIHRVAEHREVLSFDSAKVAQADGGTGQPDNDPT